MERNNENKIFVGNLNYEVDSDDLKKAFECCGAVKYIYSISKNEPLS